MKLFVAGLPYDVDDQELESIFTEYGTVSSAKVILDRETQKSRGFGFVEFADATQAQAAMDALNGASLSGKTMTVKPAEDKPRGQSGGGGGYPRSNQRRGNDSDHRSRY